MDIVQIEDEWNKDSTIDGTDLFHASLKIPKLHSKWSSILLRERVLLAKMKSEHDSLEHLLEQFYSRTLTSEELKEYGLVYPDKMIMKPDVSKWVSNHKENVSTKLKIGLQHEKIKFIESIIGQISQMSFNIRNAIEDAKFKNGS